MYQNSFVHYLTKILVDIMFYSGILSCLAMPFIMPSLTERLGYGPDVVAPYTVILLLSGLCALYIVWQLKTIFKTLLGGNPFVEKNVGCLRRCAVASFVIAIIFLVKTSIWFTIASAIIVIMFAILGLFCLTLKDVFKQAVAYKEENDWTV
ncbi:MAG: DUF2975 domain-containing protein [Firmicutes bacterium]|nr:DUF2975 domain-containing protein [Bacillota bacterium]